MTDARKLVSVVSPCYNEAEVAPAFLARLRAMADGQTNYDFEFILVDDGSRDETEAVLLAERELDPRVHVVALARNFGHQRALTAGLDFCSGDYIVILDSDLQDPPETIPAVIAALENGADIVHTVRSDRSVDPWLKRVTAQLFYRIMKRYVLAELPEDSADFKGFNRRVLDAFHLFPERVRFLRGSFATLGFRQAQVSFVREERFAGRSKYPWKAMLRLGRDAIMSNSALPLRWALYAGAGMAALAGVLTVLWLGAMLLGVSPVRPIEAVLLIGLVTTNALVLGFLGIIGEYLKVIMLETKQRPHYIVRAAHGLNYDGVAPKR